MGSIYKATNKINGKAYIGFDSNWPRRKGQHRRSFANIDLKYKFYKALRKHGWEAFEWEVLLEDARLEDEIRFIEEYDTFTNGYNTTKGGEGNLGWIMSEETKRKIASKMIGHKRCVGRVLSEETKLKISESLKGKSNGPHSEETKQKMSKARKGKSFEELYGKEKADLLKKQYSENHPTKDIEVRRKMSESHKKRTPTEKQIETCRQNAEKMRGVPRDKDVKRRISEALKGKMRSEEHRKNLSEAQKGKTVSDEIRQKISEGNLGKKRTPEQREKYRLAAILRHQRKQKE